MKENSEFIFSGNWHIENEKAWFVEAKRDILCSLDLATDKCEFVAEIPILNSKKWQMNPRCIKIDNEIFCIPFGGNSIWVYDLTNSCFKEIEIVNANLKSPYIVDFWDYENKIFALACGLKKIIELDITQKELVQYDMFDDSEGNLDSRGIRVGTVVYYTDGVSNAIYQFDLITKKREKSAVVGVEESLCGICFDGDKFWLSGYGKKIFVWDKDRKEVKIIGDFPQQFGIYKFTDADEEVIDYNLEKYDVATFWEIKAVGAFIWFIPLWTNKILYVHRETYQIQIMEMDEEEETGYSLGRFMRCKYFVEYVENDRYIGLYSFKNNCMLELDVVERKIYRKSYAVSDEWIKNAVSKETLYDGRAFDTMILSRALGMDVDCKKKNDKHGYSSIGEAIYHLS